MRAGLRFSCLILLLSAVSANLAPPAHASDNRLAKSLDGANFTNALKDPFRDLPGVKTPQKQDDDPPQACESRIGHSFFASHPYGPTRRVYRCDVDNITIESTKRPDEIDYAKQKRYYKPWVNDGFEQ